MTQTMPKAMVLAAGLGKRMRPLTEHLPKPLVKVAGVTLIDRTLDWLAASGVEEAVVNSHYLAPLLEAHLAKRKTPKIHVSYEAIVLETGGGVKQALPLLGDKPFFVVNSDTICIDGKIPALHWLMQAWDDTVDALLLVHKTADAIGFAGPGDFFMEKDGSLRRRLEAPSAPFVFTGVQMLHPRLFRHAPDGVFSLNVLYNHDMRKDGTLTRVRGLLHDGDWLHVGTPQELQQVESWLAD